jgi:hypothetical protein
VVFTESALRPAASSASISWPSKLYMTRTVHDHQTVAIWQEKASMQSRWCETKASLTLAVCIRTTCVKADDAESVLLLATDRCLDTDTCGTVLVHRIDGLLRLPHREV